MPKKISQDIPEGIKSFSSLGINLRQEGNQYKAECPLCSKDKFYIDPRTSKWDCKVCSPEGGNIYTFLNLLLDASIQNTEDFDYQELLKKKNILSIESIKKWRIAKSIIDDKWLIPGYNTDGKLIQLYRYANIVMPSAGLELGLMGLNLFNPKYKEVYICEGPWDAICLSEVVKKANVLAVPGCNTFKEYWSKVVRDKKVHLMYDNDHPKAPSNTIPSLQGIKRVCQILHNNELEYLRWGQGEYNPSLKDGYDVRDHLCKGTNKTSREILLQELQKKLVKPPDIWKEKKKENIKPIECSDYENLITAWRKAMKFRQSLEDTLCVMLSVALSTNQAGSQLFLQVIGEPGSGKTRFCEAMLTSSKCYQLESLTGFISGFKGKDADDYSMVSRINNKTLITPEADIILSNPKFMEIMSQQRRMFDGTIGASYKNLEKDRSYTGLRTPWIMAGTPVLLDTNQSKLGDRFIKVFIESPPEEEKQLILKTVGLSAINNILQTTNGKPEGYLSEPMQLAYKLTGGYVDYLRKNAAQLLNKVKIDQQQLISKCSIFAEYTAELRARPSKNLDKEIELSKELPTRLTEQFIRLALCLAVVTGKFEIDKEVLRVVAKVAKDTAKGRTQDIINRIESSKGKCLKTESIGQYLGLKDWELENTMRFLISIDVLQGFRKEVNGVKSSSIFWKLTKRFKKIYEETNSA